MSSYRAFRSTVGKKLISSQRTLPATVWETADTWRLAFFRHFGFRNGDLSGDEEWPISEGFVSTEDTEQNHRELHAVLVDALRRSPMVELYGCWADDFREKTEVEREIQPAEIVSDRFFFRERVLYRLRAKSGNGP